MNALMSAMQSCAYDTIGWGVAFNTSAQSTWPDYFTGNLICSKASGCTCPPNAQVSCLCSSTYCGFPHLFLVLHLSPEITA